MTSRKLRISGALVGVVFLLCVTVWFVGATFHGMGTNYEYLTLLEGVQNKALEHTSPWPPSRPPVVISNFEDVDRRLTLPEPWRSISSFAEWNSSNSMKYSWRKVDEPVEYIVAEQQQVVGGDFHGVLSFRIGDHYSTGFPFKGRFSGEQIVQALSEGHVPDSSISAGVYFSERVFGPEYSDIHQAFVAALEKTK